jgi:hypothetical protein
MTPPESRRRMDARPYTPDGGRFVDWAFGPAAHRRLTCPHGHHIPCKSIAPEVHFAFCPKWLGGKECGAWVAVLRIRGGFTVWASVSKEEADEWSAAHVTPGELIVALGIFDQLKRGA